MDIARRPYSTDARFFSDSEEVVRIRWYPVAEPVECLPFPSKVNSLDWSSHPYLARGVGEVYGVARPYNAAEAVPYARGLDPCKPAEVFANGEAFDPDAPPQEYDERGLPICCINHADMEGGVEWGGDFEPPPVPVSGGPNCGLATVVDPGIWYVFDEVPSAFQFFLLSVVPTTDVRLRMESDTFTGLSLRLLFMEGFCPFPMLPFPGVTQETLPVDDVRTFTGGGAVWLRSNGAETPPLSVRFRFDVL